MRKNGTPIPKLRAKSRRKLILTVDEQRGLVTGSLDGSGGLGRALSRMILSVGTHLIVYADPQGHNLKWNDRYYTYTRPKNLNAVQGPWSRSMLEPGVLEAIANNLGCSTRWYNDCIAEAGEDAELEERVGQESLRQNHFANRARLGHDLLSIVHGSGTSMDTVIEHYTVGLRDAKTLTPPELEWLGWLVDP